MDGLLDRYAGLALWLQSLIALAGLVVVALAERGRQGPRGLLDLMMVKLVH